MKFKLLLVIFILIFASCGDKNTNPASDFEFISTKNEVTITKYIGESTEVIIPKKINGNKVTRIHDEAFREIEWITSVVIPDGVTIINDYAFAGCDLLETVILPDNLKIIGRGGFVACSSLTSIVIPDSVTTIGDGAFANCNSLTSLTIPDSVISIGNETFYGCGSLSEETKNKILQINPNARFEL